MLRETHQSDLRVPGSSVESLLVGSSSDGSDLRSFVVVVLFRLDVVSIRSSTWAPGDAVEGKGTRSASIDDERGGRKIDELEEYTSVDGDLEDRQEGESQCEKIKGDKTGEKKNSHRLRRIPSRRNRAVDRA